MGLNLNRKVISFLEQHSDQKYTAKEIALWIFEEFPDECKEKQARSTATKKPLDTDDALIGQLAAEISSNRPTIQLKEQRIKTTEGRPRKYYFTEQTDQKEIEKAEGESISTIDCNQSTRLNEHDLYPLLSEFLWSELTLYSKRIDERKSQNKNGKNGNKWLHPDLVGVEDLTNDWDQEVKDCAKQYADKRTKLWSFEVKILINRSNVREVFFKL